MIPISIIVPVYNTIKYLDRCISSIIRQTFRDIEIIAVNDGSTDNSLEILSRYAKEDNRIKIINKKNQGLSIARNIGINIALGEYILHVDSDDWIEPDMCEILYKEAKENNADIVTSHIYFEYFNKKKKKKEPYKRVCNFNNFLVTFATKRGINSICNKLIKNDLYKLNNIEHYKDISLGEDSSALLRLIIFAKIIVTVNKAFYHYEIKESSMTGNKEKKVLEYIIALLKVENFYKDKNIKTDIFPILRLKIAYTNIYGNIYSQNDDYKKLKEYFISDLDNIISNKYFKTICLKYKIFVFIFLVLSKLIKYNITSLYI